ncbi:MAG: FtsX-like permease family protein [Brevinematales bacterium]|nr:FtsX-like permease family protein [Brevinematales bacterium]
MSTLLKMAFRNIKRNKRRSLLAIISVGLALMLVVVLQGLVDGLIENMIKNSTKNETGHIRIMSEEYFKNIQYMPVQHLVYNPEEAINFLKSDKKIAGKIQLITQRMRFPVLLQYSGNNKSAIGIGGDIENEKALLMLDKSIVEGNYLTGNVVEKDGKKYREVIIGKKLAEILNLKVGDNFSLMLQGADLGIHIPRFYVVGIFKTGLNMLDENLFMINIEDAKKILKTDGGAGEILIMLKNHEEAIPLSKKINSLLKNKEEFNYLISANWRESSGFLAMMDQALKIYNFLYFTIAFLGAFIITNIMMMIILERKREIGILKSMGMKKREILFLFTTEGIILGGIGSIAGVILGTIINIPLSIYGIDFTSSMGNLNFPVDNVIKWSITIGSIVGSMILGIFVSAIVSVIPSRHAAKMKAVDAIRSV